MKNKHSRSNLQVRLDQFDNSTYFRGASKGKELLWMLVQAIFVSSWLPGSWHRCVLLRLFGAQIGKGVVLKPHITIKFPWRLHIGNNSWIGEFCWIDNLMDVIIGNHCCISQGAYLCTGSHNWSSEHFDLIVKKIEIADYAWIAAFSKIAPGVKIGEGACLCLGSVATTNLASWKIYSGVPCRYIKERSIPSKEI